MKRIILLFLALSLLILPLCSCSEADEEISLSEYEYTMNYHDGFTILQLTDIHWCQGTQIGDDDYGAKEYIKNLIAEVKKHAGQIDLIEVTGDTFMLANQPAVTSFIEFMEEIALPYAIIWGNHDYESFYSPNWLRDQFVEAEHCIYIEVDDEVYGRSNFVINLLNEDKSVAWQIFNLDSGANSRGSAIDIGIDYDYLRESQFDWMEEMHARVGENTPSLVYYHIAQHDNDIYYEKVTNGEDVTYKFFKHERFCDADNHEVITEEIFSNLNVKGAFMGHDHANDWTFTSDSGIIYSLGVKTGTELYYTSVKAGDTDGGFTATEDFDVIGASLVTLHENTFDLEHFYFNERDEGNFVLWVNYND